LITFNNVGISSRLIDLRSFPERVIRAASGNSDPLGENSLCIVRNLNNLNGVSAKPGRCCVKITGRPSTTITRTAVPMINGLSRISNKLATTISNSLFKPVIPVDYGHVSAMVPNGRSEILAYWYQQATRSNSATNACANLSRSNLPWASWRALAPMPILSST